MSEWVVGIELGGTKIVLGAVNAESNEVAARRRVPTNVADGPDAAVERMATSIAELEAEIDGKFAAVGICGPNPLDHETGTLIDPPNLYGWRNVPLKQMMTDALERPVAVEHDAKAAALGEFHYGVGQGDQHMVYIVAGAGVGTAIIINGELYRGMHNLAGEAGHMTLNWEGEPCQTGIPACVQGFLRGPDLARNYQNESHKFEPITGEEVADYAANGDEIALKVMRQAGQALGTTVAMMALILDIELFVVGGSVFRAGNVLLEPARKIVPQYCLPAIAEKIRIEPVALGDDSPILGSAWLARQQLA